METAKKFHFNEFLVSVHKHSKSGMKDAGSKFIKSIRKALAKKQNCSAEFYDDVSNWVKTLIIKAYWNFDNQVVVEHKSTKCLDLLEALFSLYIDILSLQHKAKEFNPKDDYFLDKIGYYLNASPVHLVNALLRTELTEPGDAVWLEKLTEKTAERISELDKKTIDTNFYLKCVAYYHKVLYLAWGEKDTNKVLKLLHQAVENIEQPDSVQKWFEQTQLEYPTDIGKKETKDFLKAKHVSWELCREWLAKLDDDNESESDDEAEESTGTKDVVAQPVNANAEHSLRVFLEDDRIFMKSMTTPKPFGNRSTIESPVKDVVDVTKNFANGVARPEVNSPQPVAEELVVEELGDATPQVSRLRGHNRVSYKSYFLPASSLKRKKSTSPGKSPKKSVNSSGESRDRRESVENDGDAAKEESRSAVPQRYELRLRK